MILLNVTRMKQLIRLMGVLFACSALATGAFAGTEVYSGKESKAVAPAPPPACDYTWTGFYIGANGGYGWGNADTNFDPLPDAASFFSIEPITLSPDPSGFIGGGQVGFNWQMNHWFVAGLEADFQGSDMEGTEHQSPIIDITGSPNSSGTFIHAHERTQWFGTVRARLGIDLACRWLFYVTGGLAYGNVDYYADTNFQDQGGPFYLSAFDKTKAGWTVGGGTEYALSNHWSVKAEYLYYDLGNESDTAPASDGRPFAMHYNWDTTAHIVRGGLNFKF